MHKKILWILFIFYLGNSCILAQNVRSKTYIESSTLSFQQGDNPISFFQNNNFDQTLIYGKRYNNYGQQKDSYFFHSLYLKDSIGGFKVLGYEFNLMHEPFEDSRMLNVFRKWNIIRIGGAFSLEYDPYHAVIDPFDYLNANIYIRYFHIKRSARGDKTTKHTRGSWGFLIDVEYAGRLYVDFHAKPLSYMWVHARYKKDLYYKYLALIFEFEINKYGYTKNKSETTKDIYNGITLFFGPEYNLELSCYSLNLGLKMDFRNH